MWFILFTTHAKAFYLGWEILSTNALSGFPFAVRISSSVLCFQITVKEMLVLNDVEYT